MSCLSEYHNMFCTSSTNKKLSLAMKAAAFVELSALIKLFKSWFVIFSVLSLLNRFEQICCLF